MKFEVVCCPLCGSDENRLLLQVKSRRMVRCQGCGLIYRNPRPTAEDFVPVYVEETIDLREEERVAGRRSHQFRRFFDSFPDRPGRLLDIGCGYGLFLKMAQERGWYATGVDLNPQAAAYATNHRHVNAACGNLSDLHFPDGSFDLVTLWNVLDHTPDPLDVMAEAHRVLKEDGCVFIRTPNIVWQYLSFRLTECLRRLECGKVFDDRPYATFIFHQTNFSGPTLRFLFNHSGFISLGIKNSPQIPGDPYLGLGATGERILGLAKRALYGVAQAGAFVSGGRWLIGPSLEAWGRRGPIQDRLVRVRRETAEGAESKEFVHAT